MKIKFLVFIALLLASSAIAFNPSAAKFAWGITTYDFGTIALNEPVTAEFTFVNEGDAPLVITEVKASCGCTVANYTKGEIAPGATGNVSATYNAAKVGSFQKTVTVHANTTDGPMTLVLKGVVE